MPNRVNHRRILPIFVLVLAFVAAGAVVSVASGGGIRDWEPCPDAGGEQLTCPDGMVGVPYSVKFRAVEEPPCQPGEDTWHIILDAAPTGLSLAQDGTLSGTPTQPGTWSFWVEMRLPDNDHCNGTTDTSQERFTINIKPGDPAVLPKPRLTIGPEATSPGTVGSTYSLPMTANLADPKTWSIAAGSLPPGLAIDASTGIISGTPLAAGTFPFTVLAVLDAERSDTKSLTIDVRERLVITPSEEFDVRRIARTEVGVSFLSSLSATGGFGAYEWTSDDLPPGFDLDDDGTIVGEPDIAGSFRFTVAVTDEENRRAAYTARIVVAERLTVVTKKVRTAKVGRRYQAKLVTRGGILPLTFKIKRGPLPRGIFFDPSTGTFFGTPVKAGTWKISFEIVDELRVKAKGTITIVVAPAPKT